MTEAAWLASDDPEAMYFQVVSRLSRDRRRMDLFCLGCVRLVWHLLGDETRRPFEWLEAHPGERHRPSGGHIRDLFPGLARELYEAHHRREVGVRGAAVHVAYDLWADWYGYAFPNLRERVARYPGVLREDPRVYLPALMREIFGNPFRPVACDFAWRTDTVVTLSRQMYELQDFSAMPILADALQDAGCANADILDHCRDRTGGHVRGCWVIDLLGGGESPETEQGR